MNKDVELPTQMKAAMLLALLLRILRSVAEQTPEQGWAIPIGSIPHISSHFDLTSLDQMRV
jgi:hypothetical protein